MGSGAAQYITLAQEDAAVRLCSSAERARDRRVDGGIAGGARPHLLEAVPPVADRVLGAPGQPLGDLRPLVGCLIFEFLLFLR